MLEILKFILKDFWTFVGFIIILYIALYFTVNGTLRIIKYITKYR